MYVRKEEMTYTHGYEYEPRQTVTDIEMEEPEPKKAMTAVKTRGADYIHVICTDTQDVISIRVPFSNELYAILEGITDNTLTVNIQKPEKMIYSSELHGSIPEEMPFSGVRVTKARVMNARVYGGAFSETIIPVFVTGMIFADIIKQIHEQVMYGADELHIDFYRLTRNKMISSDYKDSEDNNYINNFENYSNLKR